MISDGRARAFLAHPIIRFFGYISFSVYLFMDFFLIPLHDIPKPFDFFSKVGMGIVIIGACYALFVLVERPLSRLSFLKTQKSPTQPGSGDIVQPSTGTSA